MNSISAVLILLLASSGPGITKANTSAAEVRAASGSQEARDEAALGLITFPWQKLNYEIAFLPPRPGIRGMIFSGKHRIEIYARPKDDSRLLAYDIAHELGHAIDLTHNTDEIRKKWMKERGIDPATPWFGCNRCSDYETPAGDFAETFAFLLLGPGHFSGRIAPPPTTKQVSVLTLFFPEVSFRLPVSGPVVRVR